MIIKSHTRGGYRLAAEYLKAIGENETMRLVDISDYDAHDLDEAFYNMWTVASNTYCRKPLHHISINPFKDERLTDDQLLKTVQRCEEIFGYESGHHQRVMVEHIKNGRQHFHVMWNRVSLTTARPVYQKQDWIKCKLVAREMERAFGLKRPLPRRIKRMLVTYVATNKASRSLSRYVLNLVRRNPLKPIVRPRRRAAPGQLRPEKPAEYSSPRRKKRKGEENVPDSEKVPFGRPEWETARHIAWAWDNHRADVLAQYGIYPEPDPIHNPDPAGLEL
jgi:hypothetical protein